MNAFLRYLNMFTPLTEEVQEAIMKITIRREVKGGELLFGQGTVCKEFHYLESGIARVFYYKEGNEVTAWSASER